MKTILKYIFSFALGSTMLTSCDLDTIPTTYVDAGSVFGKTGDAEKVLNGGWNYLMETFNSYANPGYGAMLRANDAMGSDVVLNSKYGFRTHNEFSAIYGKGGTNTLSWLLAYRVINDCNGVLDNIDAAEGTQADRNRIKGQALALRGFFYTCTWPLVIPLLLIKTRTLYVHLSIHSPPMKQLQQKENPHQVSVKYMRNPSTI